MISVIVPMLTEEAIIETALRRLSEMEGDFAVVVVDNGSTDESLRLASKWARTLVGPPGRGPAMNIGAARSDGDILLFLHADTTLPADAFQAVERALTCTGAVGGRFSVVFDGDDRRSRFVTALYEAANRAGLFYGDAAIFVRREVFESLHGFKSLPLMEDFDFCRRLHHAGRTVKLPQTVVSSARRWQHQGFLKTALIYATIQGLYLLGWRRNSLFRLYKAIR